MSQSGHAALSLNRPVSEREQACRYFEPDRLGSLEIDHQLKLCRLLDRQIGWLGAFQYLVNENGRRSKNRSNIGPVRHQATRFDV
jgi:hypothetical protein